MSETNLNAVDPGNGGTPATGAADPAEPGTTAGETAEARLSRMETEMAEKDRRIEEYLRMKSNAEETARENERLRSQLPPPTAVTPDAGQYAARIQRAQMRWQQIASDPNADDAVKDDALTLLALSGAVQQLPQQFTQQVDMLKVPETSRADVERKQHEAYQRGERISPATAQRLIEADRLSAQAASVNKQAEEFRRVEEAKARGVVQTRVVGIPASEIREGDMTYSQFRQAWASATPEQQDELRKRTAGGTRLKPG